MSRPDLVEARLKNITLPVGRVSAPRAEADPAAMSRKIKAMGLQLGAGKVGITELNQQWVYTYEPQPSYGKPVECNFKYVICLAVPQDPFMIANHRGLGTTWEVGWTYSYASFISVIIANFIRHLGWPARPVPTFATPYLVCPVFIDAGIGEDGRCGYVVSKELGNNFRPGGVLTDLPLVPDKPVDFGLQDFCDHCGICAETCPAGAIPTGGREVVMGVRKWKIDPEKCYRYWNTIGHACGICQVVCPWNHKNNLLHNIVREVVQRVPILRKFLVHADKIFFSYKPGPDPRWLAEFIPFKVAI